MTGRAQSYRVVYNENSVHNELTITSNDPELFEWSDPELYYGEPRIELVVGSRLIQFVIESREGEMTNFTIVGLSLSIKEDIPYAQGIDYQLTEPLMASEIAASLTTYCPVVWEAIDWLVPVGFSFSGPPLQGIQQLADEVGAIVRCQDDGSLLVRARRPVRPIEMQEAMPHITYNRSSIIVLGQNEEIGSGLNAVNVTGHMPESFVPNLQLEPIVSGDSTRSPAVGETFYIRAYWSGHVPSVIQRYVTDGKIQIVGSGAFYTEVLTEVVNFLDGMATVQFPILSLVSVEWIGDQGGLVLFVPHTNELGIGVGKFRVAKVKYVTQFTRYKILDHNVEQLIVALFLRSRPGIAVTVRTGEDPVFGGEINAPLLTTETAAIARGVAWLDQQYRKSICTISVPYDDLGVDGNIAFIDDFHIGSPGNYHITGVDIIVDDVKVINQLRLEKCLVSFNS
jgi:hypothetical protein